VLRPGGAWLRLAAYAALALASTVSLRAQTTSQPPVLAVPIAVGDTVQVDAPPGVPFLIRARIVELRPTAIVIRINATSDTVVPFGEVRWLAVRRGTRGHLIAGALVGLVAGALVGGAISEGRSKQPLGSTISKDAIVGAALSGVAGLIAGDLIRSDRWVLVIKGPSPIEDYGLLENEGVSPIPLALGAAGSPLD
jgi:hypothetical protein